MRTIRTVYDEYNSSFFHKKVPLSGRDMNASLRGIIAGRKPPSSLGEPLKTSAYKEKKEIFSERDSVNFDVSSMCAFGLLVSQVAEKSRVGKNAGPD